MSITNYTNLELKLQAEVAELKAEHIAYISRTGARILALHDELGELKAEVAELKADNENLRAYAKHERSLGAEAFAMENLDLTQQVEILKAKLAETEQARALIMQTLANTVVERDTLKAKLAEYEADEDFECPISPCWRQHCEFPR